MIKNFIVGHRPFTVFTVTASFPFAVYLFCFFFVVVFSKNNKTKTQSESFLSIFKKKKMEFRT